MMLILAYDAYFLKRLSSDACQKGPKRLSGTKHHDAYKNECTLLQLDK